MPEIDTLPTGTQRTEIALFYSGYFKHGDVDDPATYALTTRLPDSEALPTWSRFTAEDIAAIYEPLPGDVRGGSDSVLMRTGMAVGAFDALREAALRLPAGEGSGWDGVEVRHVWGDNSVAAMVWAVHALRAVLEKEKKAGIRLRSVTFARVEGGNHIVSAPGLVISDESVLTISYLLDALGPAREDSGSNYSGVRAKTPETSGRLPLLCPDLLV